MVARLRQRPATEMEFPFHINLSWTKLFTYRFEKEENLSVRQRATQNIPTVDFFCWVSGLN
jgi:hypothetical protein